MVNFEPAGYMMRDVFSVSDTGGSVEKSGYSNRS